MYVYHNIENDSVINTEQIYARQAIIRQLKKRFNTYGYREILSPVFEPYNLYATMNGTVNEQEMIKTIDNTGQVLVLRPDVTIPLTKQIAANETTLSEHLRYFYVLDVYRQTNETKEYHQSLQAGVEYFGNPTPEADAEVIALAVHLLQDCGVNHFKIELGHAGFFKQLAKEMNLGREELLQLQQLIQAKNIPEMEKLLETLALPKEITQTVASLPFLYGQFDTVLSKIEKLSLSPALEQILTNIAAIYDVLKAYHVAELVVLDLSLINHMDYYSDMIFQGFIEKVGKPVIMGGRYNQLAEQFHANFPAIGFACDVDLLLSGMENEHLPQEPLVDIALIYNKRYENKAIPLAVSLRNAGYELFTYTEKMATKVPKTKAVIYIDDRNQRIIVENQERTFTNQADLEQILQDLWEEMK